MFGVPCPQSQSLSFPLKVLCSPHVSVGPFISRTDRFHNHLPLSAVCGLHVLECIKGTRPSQKHVLSTMKTRLKITTKDDALCFEMPGLSILNKLFRE